MTLSEIPARKYTGYIWLSDKEKPIVLINKTHDFSKVDVNPFIIEALLWNEEEQVSVMVRHSGRYHVHEYKIKELKQSGELVNKEYLPHQLEHSDKTVKKVKFKQVWLPEKDPLCEGMEVLTMKALVFTGLEFENN